MKQQSSLPAAGYTPVRTDVATKAFVRRYPRTAVALRALDQVGYAPKTLAYNTAVNQVSGPFFQMFTEVVFHGGGAAALRDGRGRHGARAAAGGVVMATRTHSLTHPPRTGMLLVAPRIPLCAAVWLRLLCSRWSSR